MLYSRITMHIVHRKIIMFYHSWIHLLNFSLLWHGRSRTQRSKNQRYEYIKRPCAWMRWVVRCVVSEWIMWMSLARRPYTIHITTNKPLDSANTRHAMHNWLRGKIQRSSKAIEEWFILSGKLFWSWGSFLTPWYNCIKKQGRLKTSINT